MKRLVAALLALILLAAACGGSDETTEAPTESESASASETSERASASQTAESDSGSASEAAESESASASEVAETTTTTVEATVRTVEHAFGTTEVPSRPERLVVLNSGTILPILLFLGVDNIVGAPLPDGPIEATRLLGDADLVGVESVGFPVENPELVAALRPDMIIGFDLGLDQNYDVMSQIAPTVAVELDLNDWRGTGQRLAAALGIDAEMDAALADYDARLAALQTLIGDPSATEVTVVRALGPNIRLHTPFHFAGQVLDDVGFAWPETVPIDDPDTRFVQVSLEELNLADADHLFVFGAGGNPDGSDVDAVVQVILDHPLYPTLRAAETGGVHVVDPLGWQQGGIAAANLILDDLEGVFS